MRKIMTIILISLLYCFSDSCAQDLSRDCGTWSATSWPNIASCDFFEHGDWTLIFNDEFDYSYLDVSKWYTYVDGWTRVHGNELQYYKDENIILENGMAKLTAKREPGYYPVWQFDANGNGTIVQQYYEYTSGWMQTKAKFQYGLFEVRCKIPSGGQGFWPAFWLFGNTGEIDIFEFSTEKPKKLHTDVHLWPLTGAHEHCPSQKKFNSSFADDFHVFSMEWDEFKLVFRVDGSVVRIIYKHVNEVGDGLYDCENFSGGIYMRNPLFPDNAQSVILNLAIPCSTCAFSPSPNNQTVFPSSLDIDYIRIYKKTNSERDVRICNLTNPVNPDCITGHNIVAPNRYCETIIDTNRFVILSASNSVFLKSGFEAVEGCAFEAKISHPIRGEDLLLEEDTVITTSYEELNNPRQYSYIDSVTNSFNNSSFCVSPNPCSGSFQINLLLPENQYSFIRIVDMYGEPVYTIDNPSKQNHQVYINRKGLFIVEVETKNNLVELKKIVIQ
ncbi:MAG: hypothetical protein CW341_11395 [Bacteroidetes bacterium]|nr:hypothetical protein [Bacteroidota bacterium]